VLSVNKGASSSSAGYWDRACVTSDEALLAAGGESFAAIDLATGTVVGRGDGFVHAVVCQGSRAVVHAYSGTWTWPGGARGPEAKVDGEPALAFEDGTRVWTARNGRKGRYGPLEVRIERTEGREYEIGHQAFGTVGHAKDAPPPNTFAIREAIAMRGAVPGARLLLAAGWSPNHGFSSVEPLPWGFFALAPLSGELEPLSEPILSDSTLNLLRLPQIAGSENGAVLALATADGTNGMLAVFRAPSAKPVVRVPLPGWDEVSRVSVSPDGARVAAASVYRPEKGARMVVVDANDGRPLWRGEAKGNVYGLVLLRDGSLVWASSNREAARVSLPDGRELWHVGLQDAQR
jgi:hypothetical protein